MAAESDQELSRIVFINDKTLVIVRSEADEPSRSGDIFRVMLPDGGSALVNSANVACIFKYA